jgi:hypothetical protein
VVVADEKRLTKLFVPVQRPGCPQQFAEVLFVFLDLGQRQVVFAVNGIFEAEEIEDGADELLAFIELQVADQRKAVPGSICRTAIKVGIVTVSRPHCSRLGRTIRQLLRKIGDGSVQQVVLKAAFVVAHGPMRTGLFVTVGEFQ